MPEFQAWADYFRSTVGHMPAVMQKAMKDDDQSDQSVTVPTQWPHWFDEKYSA